MPNVTLNAGTIHYEKAGPPNGRPVVFIHGYSMGSSLWRPLSERLAARGVSCLAPTWPLGAHTEPMREDAELTMEGIAAIVAALLDALALEDVVLVGNDTGGAIAQLVATSAPERLGALVLTSCDAFEHFPPPILKAIHRRGEGWASLRCGDSTAPDPVRTQARVWGSGSCRHRWPRRGVGRARAHRPPGPERPAAFHGLTETRDDGPGGGAAAAVRQAGAGRVVRR